MASERLKNAPLVETIFEGRWSSTAASQSDPHPHHKLFVGRLFDRLQNRFPEPEALPTAQIPDAAAVGLVQQRFRAKVGGWPLIQLGPGIVTVNETTNYSWEEFQKLCVEVLGVVFSAHPKPDTLHFDSLLLRYIDAITLNGGDQDFWSFLKKKIRVTVDFPQELFADGPVKQRSDTFNLQATFVSEKPRGRVGLGFTMGKKDNEPALIWETTVHSIGEDTPKMPDDFGAWLAAAHAITHDWFHKLITGELERTFRGE